MAYNPKDYYFHKAKSEKYVARSIFKLQEIDERFKIFKQGYKILDLGAAPGSWSQYASQKIGPQGRLLGVDLQPVKLTLPNSKFITANFLDVNFDQALLENGITPPFDVVLSDMAPKTTGVKITDQTRSLALCRQALGLSKKYLRSRGSFICKLFHGEAFEEFRNDLRAEFSRVEILRPKSTRKESKEIFFIGLQKE